MRSRITWVVAGLLMLSGAGLAAAPFLTAQGSDGPADSFPGTVMDLKPTYSAFLISAGAIIATCALLAAYLRRASPAVVAGVFAIVAGLSLGAVDVVIDNPVIYREYSVLALRGPAPTAAAVAALASLLLASALIALVARRPKGW